MKIVIKILVTLQFSAISLIEKSIIFVKLVKIF
jgi:hypothetical protein